MVGKYTEKEFKQENYEEFYEHHKFQPIIERFAYDIHEVIPRFGWAFDKVDEKKPKNLLDLGCLDGSFALTIAKHFDIPVRGVDLTKEGVKIARNRALEKGLKAKFHQGAIENWLASFIDSGLKFDMITLFEIMEHVDDPEAVLKLVDQVLTPGGTVLISTPDFEAPTYGKDDEQNKCHVRLYTTADEDYEAVNKYGNTRTATSLSKQVGKDRIVEMAVHNELINCMYQ